MNLRTTSKKSIGKIFNIHSYSKADSYCFTDNNLIQSEPITKKITNDLRINGKYVTQLRPFFEYPFDYSILSIHLVFNLS